MRDAEETLAHVRGRFGLPPFVLAANTAIDPLNPIEIPNAGRDDLAALFGAMGCRLGVEVGTRDGRYAERLCQTNPGVQLACVDPWAPQPDYDLRQAGFAADKHPDIVDGFEWYYERASARLAKYRCQLIRARSVDAATLFRPASIDFVYIDANHELRHVLDDIAAWSPLVRPGGIISGHDYARMRNQHGSHVVEAVHAWTHAYKIQPWFVLGRATPMPGEVRDKYRSWFWVQQ